MVNGVSFGGGSSTADMTGGYDSIRQSQMVLGGGNTGGGDTLSLSSRGKKKSTLGTLIKGGIAAGVAVLALRIPAVRRLPGIRNLLKHTPKAKA